MRKWRCPVAALCQPSVRPRVRAYKCEYEYETHFILRSERRILASYYEWRVTSDELYLQSARSWLQPAAAPAAVARGLLFESRFVCPRWFLPRQSWKADWPGLFADYCWLLHPNEALRLGSRWSPTCDVICRGKCITLCRVAWKRVSGSYILVAQPVSYRVVFGNKLLVLDAVFIYIFTPSRKQMVRLRNDIVELPIIFRSFSVFDVVISPTRTNAILKLASLDCPV